MRMVRPLPESSFPRLFRLPSPLALAAVAGVASTLWLGLSIGEEVPLLPAVVATASWSTAGALFLSRRGPEAAPPVPQAAGTAVDLATAEPTLFDSDSGLVSAATLKEAMRTEIARASRHGNPLALALFDVQVVSAAESTTAPSPIDFIVSTFRRCARDSDVVARLDRSHFAVLLTESGAAGCQGFVDRLRSALSAEPYSEREGARFYLQSRAGWATSLQGHATVSEFARAALQDLNSRYVSQGAWDPN